MQRKLRNRRKNGRKGKLDFYHEKDNLVLDLKVVWNLDRFMEDFTYKGELKIHHRYIRQLAMYSNLCNGTEDGQLIVTDHNWNHNVLHFPNSVLLKAQELNERDIKKLESMLQSPTFFTTFNLPDTTDLFFDQII